MKPGPVAVVCFTMGAVFGAYLHRDVRELAHPARFKGWSFTPEPVVSCHSP